MYSNIGKSITSSLQCCFVCRIAKWIWLIMTYMHSTTYFVFVCFCTYEYTYEYTYSYIHTFYTFKKNIIFVYSIQIRYLLNCRVLASRVCKCSHHNHMFTLLIFLNQHDSFIDYKNRNDAILNTILKCIRVLKRVCTYWYTYFRTWHKSDKT